MAAGCLLALYALSSLAHTTATGVALQVDPEVAPDQAVSTHESPPTLEAIATSIPTRESVAVETPTLRAQATPVAVKPGAAEVQVEELLSTMTDEQKVGQI